VGDELEALDEQLRLIGGGGEAKGGGGAGREGDGGGSLDDFEKMLAELDEA
jgi:hypothetical protein